MIKPEYAENIDEHVEALSRNGGLPGDTHEERKAYYMLRRIEEAEWKALESDQYMAAIRKKIPRYRMVCLACDSIKNVRKSISSISWKLQMRLHKGFHGDKIPLRVRLVQWPSEKIIGFLDIIEPFLRKSLLRVAKIDPIEELVIKADIGASA